MCSVIKYRFWCDYFEYFHWWGFVGILLAIGSYFGLRALFPEFVKGLIEFLWGPKSAWQQLVLFLGLLGLLAIGFATAYWIWA